MRRQDQQEAEIIAAAGEKNAITVATNMAGRGTDIALGEGVEDLGGLHVISLSLHDSYRIERQLFGRSARQGDSGSVEAILSLEDAALEKRPGCTMLRLLSGLCTAKVIRLADGCVGRFCDVRSAGMRNNKPKFARY